MTQKLNLKERVKTQRESTKICHKYVKNSLLVRVCGRFSAFLQTVLNNLIIIF
jgi:hypothetical protein